MNTVIVIPARYGSTRFPGKPLANILGKSLLERTWRIAQAVTGVDTVIVATDDERIAEHAATFGARVQLTAKHWHNGSERSLEAIQLLKLSPDIVVNLQGDAVLTPPAVISTLLQTLKQTDNARFALATPCVQLTLEEYRSRLSELSKGTTHGTMVTFDQEGKALYFSRALIPFPHNSNVFSAERAGARSPRERSVDTPVAARDAAAAGHNIPIYRHIGLYAFRYEALQKYVSLQPTPLEKVEGLEQLRALEHGMPIKVVLVDYKGRTHWSVDHPQDIVIVESIIKKEGELVAVTS